jgi:hypothetical protein
MKNLNDDDSIGVALMEVLSRPEAPELSAAKRARGDLSRWSFTGIICKLGNDNSHLHSKWKELANKALGNRDPEWLTNYTKECQQLNTSIAEEKQRYYYGR